MSFAQMKDMGKYLNATLAKEMGRSNIFLVHRSSIFLVHTWCFLQWNALLQLDITLLPPSAQLQAQSWTNEAENRRLLERNGFWFLCQNKKMGAGHCPWPSTGSCWLKQSTHACSPYSFVYGKHNCSTEKLKLQTFSVWAYWVAMTEPSIKLLRTEERICQKTIVLKMTSWHFLASQPSLKSECMGALLELSGKFGDGWL